MSPVRELEFQKTPLGLRDGPNGKAVQSLPELISYNVTHNPFHRFCLQAEPNRDGSTNSSSYDIHTITMQELGKAIDLCVEWLQSIVPAVDQGETTTMAPVALFLESNVGLFIYIAALLQMGVPVLLLSARLSSESVNHLLSETGSQLILLSKRTQATLDQDISESIKDVIVPPYLNLLSGAHDDGAATKSHISTPRKPQPYAPLILHSSGTTGLPKPIKVDHQYPLVYAACHEFPDDMPIDWTNMSTLPLYHGFGLLAPCLSLSIGLTCCFPPASIIPSAKSTVDLLRAFSAESLMSVPSIMGEMLELDEDQERTAAFNLLAQMKFIAVGGGALDVRVGEILADEHNIKILNHYGVTEIGAIAPIFCPGPDYDWHYLRIRNDIGLRLVERGEGSEEEDNGSKRYKLVGVPIGSDAEFEIQDEMERRPGSDRIEIRLLGRRDDLIVLKTGEKVLARLLEQAISEEPAVKTAVCLGQGCFEVLVLVEPSPSTKLSDEDIINRVWEIAQKVNPSLDQHARVSSQASIFLKPASKTIPRSDKGSIMRAATHTEFRDEIETTLKALELETTCPVTLDSRDLEASIGEIISYLSPQTTLGPDDDFFERGMDSMWSTRLARLISSAMRTAAIPAPDLQVKSITAPFIYQNPSVRSLATAVGQLLSGIVPDLTAQGTTDRSTDMEALLDEYSDGWTKESPAASSRRQPKKVVLMTGSTGNLGSHVLHRLTNDKSVERVVCLIRSQDRKDKHALRSRQESGLFSAGIQLDEVQWANIHLIPMSSDDPDSWMTAMQPFKSSLTHIIHMAWPMDFNRSIRSFRPHLDMVRNLVNLARSASTAAATQDNMDKVTKEEKRKVRLLFTSSIAVVRHATSSSWFPTKVAERLLVDPSSTVAMGYAEAKWVCEHMLVRAAQTYPEELETLVVRVGQLSGPEESSSAAGVDEKRNGGGGGVWKTEEHIPVLVKASQTISAVPHLEGTMSWLPVDRSARCLRDMLFYPGLIPPGQDNVVHLENPIRVPSSDVMTCIGQAIGVEGTLPYDEWLRLATEKAGDVVGSLDGFFAEHFRTLGTGWIVLDTKKARGMSCTLRATEGISRDLLGQYVARWRSEGFLA